LYKAYPIDGGLGSPYTEEMASLRASVAVVVVVLASVMASVMVMVLGRPKRFLNFFIDTKKASV